MSDEIKAIRDLLDDLAVFLVRSQASNLACAVEIGGQPYAISWSGETGLVSVSGAEKEPWSVPMALLGPIAQAVDSGAPVAAPVPTEATNVWYNVMNTENQLGQGRWDTIPDLIEELHPLREDLKIVAIENDQVRDLNTQEAITFGMLLKELQDR